MFADVSKECSTTTFRVEEEVNQAANSLMLK
jgi:hypothetical protein